MISGATAATAAGASAAGSPLGDPAIERAVFSGTTAAQPDSLLLNPAALSLGPSGLFFHASASADVDWVRIDRRTIDPATGDLAGGPTVTDTPLSPGAAVGVYGVGAEFAVGAQVVVPQGERFVDVGDAGGYHARGGRHQEYMLALGGAYRRRGLAFGATFRVAPTELTLRFDRDTALDAARDPARGIESDCGGAPCGLEHPAARERYRVDASTSYLPGGQTIAVSFGGVVEVAPDWWVGVAYHLPQGTFSQVEAEGEVEVERAPRDGGETITGEATVRFTLPQRLRAGVRGRVLSDVDLVGELRWDQLGVLTRYDVRLYGLDLADAGVPEIVPRPRGLRDEVALQVGLEQVDTGQRWVAGARLGVERGTTDEARLSPLNIDPTAVTADLGVQVRLSPAWLVTAGYGLRWSPATDSGRGSYDPIDQLACADAGLDVDEPACQAVAAGYALPTASGTYTRVDNTFRLVVRYVYR